MQEKARRRKEEEEEELAAWFKQAVDDSNTVHKTMPHHFARDP